MASGRREHEDPEPQAQEASDPSPRARGCSARPPPAPKARSHDASFLVPVCTLPLNTNLPPCTPPTNSGWVGATCGKRVCPSPLPHGTRPVVASGTPIWWLPEYPPRPSIPTQQCPLSAHCPQESSGHLHIGWALFTTVTVKTTM